MTTLANIKPTAGDNGNSFEWIWDVTASPNVDPRVYINVPDITGLTPTAPPKLKDDTTYANKGQTSTAKTGEDWTMQVQVKGVRDNTGEFQPELLVLINAADSVGQANVIGYRYYHATSSALAYEGSASVEWTRVNTGNDDTEFFQFTLTSKGDRKKITNPARAGLAPTLTSALPSGAATGAQITIKGAGFSTVTGAAGVKIGGTNATSYVIVDPTTIVAVLPAGTAGSAPVTVTNPTGASAPLAYTRA